jgi:NTE family protein
VPALRLGAERLVVVSPHRIAAPHRIATHPCEEHENQAAFSDPLFLIGKTLNALLLDHIDNDIDSLTHINAILAAGSRRFGPAFLDGLNAELELAGGAAPVRPVEATVIRASRDIGQIAAELVLLPEFARRVKGIVGRVLRRLAEAGAAAEADLLSYLLFDREYAVRLMELGRADAALHHEALCSAFSDGAGHTLAGDARA